MLLGPVARLGFRHIGFRLGAIEPGLLLVDFLFQSANGIEIFLKLLLVLLAKFPVQGFGLAPHHIEDAVLPLEALGLRSPFLRRVFEEHGPVSRAHVNTGHLHPGTGKAKKVAFPDPEGHGWKAGGRTMILS